MQFTRMFTSIVCLALGLAASLTEAAQYEYDQLGRLISVVESDGSSVTYAYDANGNILTITRTGATMPLVVESFAPLSGPVGTTMVIRGTGFSPVAGQNAVSIGGQPATVSSASPTTLVANVPAGATSGFVSVSVNGSTATSAASFTVTTIRITDFTPKIGPSGTSVIIEGEGFDQDPLNNTVQFNVLNATVATATTSQLAVSVPAAATSGRISISAPSGSAASEQDFIVPPAGYTANRVGTAARLTPMGTGLVFTANATNKIAMVLFDATIGERVSLAFTNISMDGYWYLYAPDGTQVDWSGFGLALESLDFGPLPQTGTYTFVLKPTVTAGSATIRVVKDALGSIQTDGTPLPLALAAAQNAMLTFDAVADETYSFVLTNYSSSPENVATSVSIVNPDGTSLKSCGSMRAGNDICRFRAPVTGGYRIRLNASGGNATSYEARLNIDFRVTLVPGSPIEMQLDRIGRNGLLEFSVATGQVVTVNLANIVTSPAGERIRLSVYDSSGAQVDTYPGYENVTLNFSSLPAGEYVATAIPENAATASFRIGFAAQQPLALSSNGETVPFSAELADQDAYFTFTGNQGQYLALGLTGLAFQSGANGNIWVQIRRPDGSQLTSVNCGSAAGSCQIPLRNLSSSGTYRLSLHPSVAEKMNAAVTLSQSVTGTLMLDVPLEVTFASPGQNAALTFDQPTQRTLALNVGSLNLLPAGASVTVRVFNSTGSQVASGSGSTTAGVALPNLAAGSYLVTVDSPSAAVGTLQAIVTQGTPVLTDGTLSEFSTASPGEMAYFTFAGNAGDNIGIGLTGLVLSPASPTSVTVRVYRPDNSQLASISCYVSNNGCLLALRNLPVSGTYRIEVDQAASQHMSFALRVVPPTGGFVSPSNSPITAAFDLPGRYALYTFDAVTGGVVTLRVAQMAMAPASSQIALRIYNPGGTQVDSVYLTDTADTINLTNLVEGTYTVTAVPTYAATGTAQVYIASGMTGSLPIDGSSTSYSSGVPGQNGYFTFAGTAGQNVGLGITGYSLTPGSPSNFRVRILRPDNGELSSTTCYLSNPGCQVSMRSLAASGTYRVQLEVGKQQSASFALTLSQSVGGVLAPSDTPVPVNFSVPGQDAQFSFTATAGQNMDVRVDGLAMLPANSPLVMRIYGPTGAQVSSTSISSTPATVNLFGLSAGTYSISIVPTYASTGNVQLTVVTPLAGTAAADGTTTTYSTTVPGQRTYLTFTGSAGDNLGLGLTGLSLSPGSPSSVTLRVLRPDGSAFVNTSCSTSQTGCLLSLRNLPVTGTYRIQVEQGQQQNASFSLTLSQSVTGTLSAGVPLAFTFATPGQNGVFTFTAIAGQSIPITLAAPSLTPAGSQVSLRVYNAGGTQLGVVNATTNAATLNLTNLAAGTYTILVGANYAATGNLQISRP